MQGTKRRMLTLIESAKEKAAAHRTLQTQLEKAWPSREMRVIAWRPDSRRMMIHHNGRFWFGSLSPNPKDTTPRYWDPYGEYRENGNLQITVEINVPTKSNERRASGFFARNRETEAAYLMHDGGVGGGRQGVGRAAFLAWSDAKLMPVLDSHGDKRFGLVIASLESGNAANDISRFVQRVLDFKEAVKNGETTTPQARRAQQSYEDYYDEFMGKKRRRQIDEIEYISRHGDIVRALRNWRRRTAEPSDKIVKNAYIDLGIQSKGLLKELYEVKTGCDRQSLYSAIGQVIVHDDGQDGRCKRFLVLPNADHIPDDLARALTRARISILRFEIRGDEVRILEQ